MRTKIRFCIAVIALLLTAMSIQVLAKTVDVLDGQISVSDSAGSNSLSGGTVTITAKGSLFSKKTNNITITNETSEQAKLSFDYTTSGATAFTIAGASAATSGSYSVTLVADGTLSISITSNNGLSGTTATLTLSNFSLEPVVSANITFEYDSNYGNITVDGKNTESGDIVNIEGEKTLVATTKNGGVFLGWVNKADNKILSTAASYPFAPTGEMTVKAVFGANTKPCFGVGASSQKSVATGLLGLGKLYYDEVGTSYIFDDLTEAASFAAADRTNKAVVLLNSATLSAGDYTIPAGVTLLIPFDSANSMYTTNAVSVSSYAAPSAYRTLTMADDANLIINGAVSVSAKHKYVAPETNDGGAVSGAYGHIKMNSGSTITVNDGGTLYAYGYITGEGTVIANSGGSVYEIFQVADFRGGTVTTDMAGEKETFPLSQYYVQNIEVPLRIYAGATEYTYTTIYMSASTFDSTVKFIGSGCMFDLGQGSYAEKRYDGSTDRIVVDVYGNVSLSSVVLDVGGTKIDSSEFVLPINNNYTINIKSGTTSITQQVALQPGAEVCISSGATGQITSGALYVYDADQWGKFCYKSSCDATFVPIKYAPSKTYTRTDSDLKDAVLCVDGTLIATEGYLYSTASGGNVCSDGSGVVTVVPGSGTVTKQYSQKTDGDDYGTEEYVTIEITPAKLKNGDGSYVKTARAGEPLTYTYTDGYWKSNAVASVMGAEKDYRTLASAIANYDNSYIQMLGSPDDTGVTIDKNVILDLNGNTVNTSLTINEGCVLYGMDSATNALGMVETDETYTYGTIVGNVSGTVAPAYAYNLGDISRAYVTHIVSGKNDAPDTYSFHRARFNIERYTYYPVDKVFQLCALYMSDEKGLAAIDDYALVVNGVEKWDSENGSGTSGLQSVSNVTEGYTAVNGFRLFGGDNTANYDGNISVNAAIKVDNKVVDKVNPVPLDLTGGANE